MALPLFRQFAHDARFLPSVVLFLLAGCATSPTPGSIYTGAPSLVVSGGEQSDPAAAVEYHVLAGELAIQRGNRKQAAQEYVAALAYSDDPQLAQRAARVALFADEPELAYQAAQAWSAAEPDSDEAQKIAVQLALRSGNAQTIALHAEAIIEHNSDGIEAGFRQLTDLLSGDAEHADVALQVMQGRVDAYPEVAEAHYSLGLLALRYERMELADQSVQRALALRPDWADAVLLRASILVRRGKIDEATALIASLGGSKVEQAEYHLSYGRLLLDAEQTAAAADEFDEVLRLQPDNTDVRYGLGLLALSLNQPERARRALSQLYATHEHRDDAAYYLGNIADTREDYAEARKWYARVTSGSYVFDAHVRAARARYKQGDLAGARAELVTLRQANPELAARLYMAEAELLYDNEQYGQALEVYNRALVEEPYDADLLYGRSLVYERVGKFEQAESDLRALLERDPDNPRALNALGYMLTNHGEHYQEALQYIQQAFEADPEDPAVIDSMGWVQYRLGRLQKAREHLQRAYELFPDPEVAAHFGEVLWQLGERDKAQSVWQEALAKDPDNPVVLETVQRLSL